jgi:hypothetical protein
MQRKSESEHTGNHLPCQRGGMDDGNMSARDRVWTVSLKDDIDKIVGIERAKLERADCLDAEFPDRQQQRFRQLRGLIEELRASVDARFLRVSIEDHSATVEVGKCKLETSSFVTDMQWQLAPNYSRHFSETSVDYLLREEPGFRVAETKCPRFPADAASTTMLLFETEAEIVEHLSQAIAKRIASYLHRMNAP